MRTFYKPGLMRNGKPPKTAGKTLMKRWLLMANEALRMANYVNADFDPFQKVKANTQMVKDVTYNYRQSWVSPPLQILILELTALIDGQLPSEEFKQELYQIGR